MWCAMAQCYDLMSRKVEARDSTNLQGFTICVGAALSSYPGPKLVFMLGEALRCYEKAHRCGDRERMALPRLARLHKDLGQKRWGFVDGQQAIFVYNERTPTQEICLSRHGDPHSETHISYFDSGFDSLKESAELEGKPQLTTPRCLSRMAPAMQAYCFFDSPAMSPVANPSPPAGPLQPLGLSTEVVDTWCGGVRSCVVNRDSSLRSLRSNHIWRSISF